MKIANFESLSKIGPVLQKLICAQKSGFIFKLQVLKLI